MLQIHTTTLTSKSPSDATLHVLATSEQQRQLQELCSMKKTRNVNRENTNNHSKITNTTTKTLGTYPTKLKCQIMDADGTIVWGSSLSVIHNQKMKQIIEPISLKVLYFIRIKGVNNLLDTLTKPLAHTMDIPQNEPLDQTVKRQKSLYAGECQVESYVGGNYS